MLVVRGITLSPENQIGYLGSPDQVLLQQGYAGFESSRQPDLLEPIRLQARNNGAGLADAASKPRTLNT